MLGVSKVLHQDANNLCRKKFCHKLHFRITITIIKLTCSTVIQIVRKTLFNSLKYKKVLFVLARFMEVSDVRRLLPTLLMSLGRHYSPRLFLVGGVSMCVTTVPDAVRPAVQNERPQ